MSEHPNSAATPSAAARAPARPPFVEPTKSLPLRWGSYRWRLAGGTLAIVFGVASVFFTSTYTLPFLAVGSTLQIAGWILLPAGGARRLFALTPCLLASWIMLAGADFAPLSAIFLAAWLLVRRRPALAWVSLALPLGVGFACGMIFNSYEQNWAVFALSGASAVGGAWIALFITRNLSARSAKLEQ